MNQAQKVEEKMISYVYFSYVHLMISAF